MSQLLWMWSLIPTSVLIWIINFIILSGLVCLASNFFGRWIPFFNDYVRFLKPIGVFLLVLGVWMRGGYDVERAWEARVADLEAQVKQSEEKAKEVNNQLDKAIKAKTKTIKEVQVVIKERIKEVETKIDADCKVDREALDILNDSAKNQKGRK